jgi:RimJ/RimL family protein N-acetyltransferase
VKNAFLIGSKVYLRPLELADAPTLVGWMNDPNVRRTLNTLRPLNEQREREFIERTTNHPSDISFGIVARAADRFIGTTGLMLIKWSDRNACFGISIGDTSCWGRGYGTDATRLVTGYAFETLNLHRVWLHVFDYNAAGIKAYERVGYRREGVLREAVYRDGAYHDVLSMAILREEWLNRRSAAAARPPAASPARRRKSSR